MLYYLKPLVYVTYQATTTGTAWFYHELNDKYTEHYVSRRIHRRIHFWPVYNTDICLCCHKVKWNWSLEWRIK